MNIFRGEYEIVKKRLSLYGKSLKANPLEAVDASFYEEKLKSDGSAWDKIITSYLAYGCSDVERKFIYLLFFKQEKAVKVGTEVHIGETTCYEWGKTVLGDLTGLALQERLIRIDITQRSTAETFYGREFEIETNTWQELELLLSKNTHRNKEKIKREVEAMLMITNTGIPWRDLSENYGSWKTIYNKYNRWVKSGLWELIEEIARAQ